MLTAFQDSAGCCEEDQGLLLDQRGVLAGLRHIDSLVLKTSDNPTRCDLIDPNTCPSAGYNRPFVRTQKSHPNSITSQIASRNATMNEKSSLETMKQSTAGLNIDDDATADRKILIAVDFGTTFSGVAWAQTRRVWTSHQVGVARSMLTS